MIGNWEEQAVAILVRIVAIGPVEKLAFRAGLKGSGRLILEDEVACCLLFGTAVLYQGNCSALGSLSPYLMEVSHH